MMSKEDIDWLRDFFSSTRKVVITSHRSPDGDAIGSSLGLCHALVAMGHEVKLIVPDDFPAFFNWMPGIEQVEKFYKRPDKKRKWLAEAELVFSLDYNALVRTHEMQRPLSRLQVPFVMIDHHPDPEPFAKVCWSDTTASSTAELVNEFIHVVFGEQWLSAEVATCLYTGLVTDTGSFRYATSERTLQVAAALKAKGAATDQVYSGVFDSYSLNRLKLLGFSISQKLETFMEGRAAVMYLSKQELEDYGYQTGDTEGLVNYSLSLKGVVMGVLIMEKDKVVKLSFRSKGTFPVNQIAREHFGGGGHRNAAGGVSHLSLEDTVNKVKEVVTQMDHLFVHEEA